MKPLLTRFAATAILLSSLNCAKNPVTGRQEFMLLSKDQEIAMGRQSDPEIISFFGLYDDQRLQKFIEEKGQQMAAISHRKDLPYQFRVVDSPVVNAFAVPGGYVYFTRGIMAHFNNEAEFVGVLGHEIGHITARHSAKQYSRAMAANLGITAGAIFSPEFAQFADVAQTGLGLLFLKFGRDAESQSDKLGVEYSSRIGYDAQEMAGFFTTLDRMREEGGQEVPTFLSTHPDPADRERKVARQASVWKNRLGDQQLKVNRDSYLKMIDGLIYGEDPKQGFTENNVFYHPELRFQFPIPSGWKVQNTPQAVQLSEPNGNALVMLTLSQGTSLQAAAQSLVQKYQLQVVESANENVNGMNAMAIVADQRAQQQQQNIRALIYLIEYGGNIYTFIGASAAANFNTYGMLFKNTATGFNVLTDASKLNRKPERIKIRTVEQTATLTEVLRRFGTNEKRIRELAVLNGMLEDERVEAGTLIKTIE